MYCYGLQIEWGYKKKKERAVSKLKEAPTKDKFTAPTPSIKQFSQNFDLIKNSPFSYRSRNSYRKDQNGCQDNGALSAA
jgi:hypothetical protein